MPLLLASPPHDLTGQVADYLNALHLQPASHRVPRLKNRQGAD